MVEEEIIVFDLIYFTQNNSDEDKNYYQILSSKARNSSYYFVQPKRPSIFNCILLKVKSINWYSKIDYDNIFLASIDAKYITSLVRHYKKAKLITFDDGTANIYKDDAYFIEPKQLRQYIYHFLIQSLTLDKIKSRIHHHYTMYKGFENIVEDSKLRFLDKIQCKNIKDFEGIKTYFIGTPFEEVMSAAQILRLEDFVKTQDIDAYVAHPRERNMLDIGVPILSKHGRIAEDAIIADAGNKRIRLVGWFSSVMLNLESVCESRIVLLPKDGVGSNELYELSKKSGCTPILI